MELSDNDFQAMDAVLDGHASTEEAERVRVLTADPSVAMVMEQLRADRAARVAVYASMEPDTATVERFHWRLNAELADAKAAERASLRGANGWSLSRVGSVAAACVAVGFFGGWIGRGAPLRPSKTAQPIEMTDSSGQQPIAQNSPADEITVPVSNEYGQVVAFQKFRNSVDARNFTEDLNRANSSTGDDRVKLMSNEKY